LSKRDYYEVLEIDRNASEQEIKRAYRKQAVKYHPDKNAGNKAAEENFKEAAEAYSILGDAQKRAQYDRFGHSAVGGQGGINIDPSSFSDFGDIFGDFLDLVTFLVHHLNEGPPLNEVLISVMT